MTWLVVVNPRAGGGRGRKFAGEVVGLLKSKDQKFIELVENSEILTRESVSQYLKNNVEGSHLLTGVIAIGGDGLVHLLIQLLAHTHVPLLVFPAGTGNDFVRAQRFPLNNNLEILNYALNNNPHYIDLGGTESGYFAAILSTGFDSLVNERANAMKWITGPMKYNLAILQELPLFTPRHYQFTIDGRFFETQAMLIAVANGHSYGGGMQVCPQATFRDGFFDVMILKPVSKGHFLRIFPKVFSGNHLNDPAVEILRAHDVSISADAIAYADGERIGSLPITARVIEKSLLTWSRVAAG